jgi:hypothetical protein
LAKALDGGRRGRRAEAGDAGRLQPVGEPGHQRRLGADHGQVDAKLGGQLGEPEQVVHGDVMAGCQPGDAGVSRRRVQLAQAG